MRCEAEPMCSPHELLRFSFSLSLPVQGARLPRILAPLLLILGALLPLLAPPPLAPLVFVLEPLLLVATRTSAVLGPYQRSYYPY